MGKRNEMHRGVKTEISPPVRSVNVSRLPVKEMGARRAEAMHKALGKLVNEFDFYLKAS